MKNNGKTRSFRSRANPGPTRHLEALGGSIIEEKSSKWAKMAKDGAKMGQDRPRWPEDGARKAQDGRKMAQ